jgi:hypothetical protein
MDNPRLIQSEGKTQVLPSFTRIVVDGKLYLLDQDQKQELIALDGQHGTNVCWEDVCKLFVLIKKLEPVTPEEADAKGDWELLVAALYHCQKGWTIHLTTVQEMQVRVLGDGYGKMSWKELVRRQLAYDWSHVRDSSPEAVLAMAAKIREFLGQ